MPREKWDFYSIPSYVRQGIDSLLPRWEQLYATAKDPAVKMGAASAIGKWNPARQAEMMDYLQSELANPDRDTCDTRLVYIYVLQETANAAVLPYLRTIAADYVRRGASFKDGTDDASMRELFAARAVQGFARLKSVADVPLAEQVLLRMEKDDILLNYTEEVADPLYALKPDSVVLAQAMSPQWVELRKKTRHLKRLPRDLTLEVRVILT